MVTAEFDGMYKVEMTLTPSKPVAVKDLKVVIPLAPSVAEYLHATGEGIRTGFDYCFLPKDKNGRIWDCRKVDSQPMLVGSFIPYLWVGDTKGGIAWFADGDEGWDPNDKEPAIEIRRDGPDSVDLVLNLVSAPATLDKPRRVVFGFPGLAGEATRQRMAHGLVVVRRHFQRTTPALKTSSGRRALSRWTRRNAGRWSSSSMRRTATSF